MYTIDRYYIDTMTAIPKIHHFHRFRPSVGSTWRPMRATPWRSTAFVGIRSSADAARVFYSMGLPYHHFPGPLGDAVLGCLCSDTWWR